MMSEEEDGQQKDVGKGKTSRKNDTWTMEESNELLNLLVNGYKRGWRNTSGVISKQTVETRILLALNEKLKHMNANAVLKPKTFENYLSRWKWFKKRYTDMCTLMRFNSGFGWSHKDQIFTAPEEVWKDFIEKHKNLAFLRSTSVTDYDDLRIVVGNGTAVGRASFGVGTETDAPIYGLEDKRKSTLEDLSWVERIFGIFKSRFLIFKSAPPFPYETQAYIVLACVGLHNFLRKECRSDEFPPEEDDDSSSESSSDDEETLDVVATQTQTNQREFANVWRSKIATKMWKDATGESERANY